MIDVKLVWLFLNWRAKNFLSTNFQLPMRFNRLKNSRIREIPINSHPLWIVQKTVRRRIDRRAKLKYVSYSALSKAMKIDRNEFER
jgi:hypothetical protein